MASKPNIWKVLCQIQKEEALTCVKIARCDRNNSSSFCKTKEVLKNEEIKHIKSKLTDKIINLEDYLSEIAKFIHDF